MKESHGTTVVERGSRASRSHEPRRYSWRGLVLSTLLVSLVLAACSRSTDVGEQLQPDSVLVQELVRLDTQAEGESGSSLQDRTVGGTIEVFIDTEGWMREVVYALDGEYLETRTTAPFSIRIDTTSLDDGKHVLAIDPRMPNGRSRDAVEIVFYVRNVADEGNEDRDGAEEQPDEPATNVAPSVDAGDDLTVAFGESVELRASVDDDGLPEDTLSVSWSVHEGPGTVEFADPSSAGTRASFAEPGRYALRVRVSDGELRAIDTVSVTVEPVEDEAGSGDGEEPQDPGTGDDGDGGTDGQGDGEDDAERPAPSIDPESILWVADSESGDISQWSEDVEGLNIGCGGPQNSGGGTAYASTDVARSGSHSIALDIRDVDGDQGTRMFRGRCESQLHPDGLYYSVWFYLPTHFETLDGWWNVFQFKSKPWGYDGGSDPMWVLDLQDRGDGTMGLRLRDKISGSSVYHGSTDVDFPTGEWVHLEAFFKGGHENDGVIQIWQNGVELWNMTGIDTIREGGDIRWAVNNYTSAIRPDPAIIYIDDAAIATQRVGPDADLSTLR